MTKVFVSHSSEDGRAVTSLVGDLQRAGTQVWLDHQLKGGDAWWPSILSHIRACTVFVFAVSENSLNSEPCQAELRYAMDLGLPILPVQLGEVRSYRIDTIFSRQIIDHRNPTASSAAALFGAIAELRTFRSSLPDPLPTPPPDPYEYLRRLGEVVNGPEPVSYTQQVDILNQLREKYRQERDPKAHADVRHLLETLRDRPETAQSAAEDINTLLQSANRNTGPHRQVPPPRTRSRKPLAWLAAIIVLLAVVTGGIIGGYLLLKPSPTPVAGPPEPGDLQVAWSDDGFGIDVGDPNAPSRISLFIDPQCWHCANFDALYGDEISRGILDGDLQVTYRPLIGQDEEKQNDYSSRVANALFLAASPDTGTTPQSFAKFVKLLWNPPTEGTPDNAGIAAMAEDSGIPSDVVELIDWGEAAVEVQQMYEANLDEFWRKAPRTNTTPVVYDEVAGSTVDFDNRDWLNRLDKSG
ncbi:MULTISPECIES: TIR domain-containing protein [unclassified Mycobacterium]|uniref:TIR domain-containing protein n=1 Tax=unclassified Mycobacterium TaxID=2642494 RepID=UPI0029C6BE6E|nr:MULTISPECIES: TIR domain-containing protein [unclassified Mycobacterium]